MAKNENGKIHTPRLCHVIKKDDFDGYGFNLHAEKGKPGQYIGKVDDGSPAESAGLKQGDRIIEVNGVNIGSDTHKQVVQRIKAIASEVQLLVVDPSVPVTKDNKLVDPPPRNGSVITTIAQNPPSPSTDTDKHPEVSTLALSAPASSITPDIVVPLPLPLLLPNEDTSYPNNNNQTSPAVATDNETVVDSKSLTESPKSLKNQNVLVTTESSPVASLPLLTSGQIVNGGSGQDVTLLANKILDPKSINSSESTTVAPAIGSLNLNMTAAELRAKLAAKKKFDPKSDSVDLRKKFEIVQKL